MAAVADPTGQNPPGPVGFGPGFWRYDNWGGQWRNDWVPAAGGTWLLSGENAGDQASKGGAPAGANPAAGPNMKRFADVRRASPHFNAALAATYARLNPNVGTEFLSAGEAGLNPGFNPDIAALAGKAITRGWQYPSAAPPAGAPAGSVMTPAQLAAANILAGGTGTRTPGAPPTALPFNPQMPGPPSAPPAQGDLPPDPWQNNLPPQNDVNALNAGTVAPGGVDPSYLRLVALARLAQQIHHPLGAPGGAPAGGPVPQ